MNIMASRIYRNVNSGVFRFRQRANGPSDLANIKLNGHRMDEISLNQTGIGIGIGSGVSGGTMVFEVQKEIGLVDFVVGEHRV